MTSTLSRTSVACGELEYLDTRGGGPVVVLLHGLLMDETLWRPVVEELRADHRCVVPVLPLGAHRIAATAGVDLSLRSVAALVAEFLERLDLRSVTLVGSDTGGAIVQLLAASDQLDRVARLVLVSCDAFDNFPPGLTGRTLVLTGRLPPPLFGLFMRQLRLRAVRRLPLAFGWLTKRGDATSRSWIDPVLRDGAVRRDVLAVLRSIRAERDLLQWAAARLRAGHRPALVVWAARDRVMPVAHAHRLGSLLGARVVEINDTSTLVPLDQPEPLAAVIRDFVRAHVTRRADGAETPDA